HVPGTSAGRHSGDWPTFGRLLAGGRALLSVDRPSPLSVRQRDRDPAAGRRAGAGVAAVAQRGRRSRPGNDYAEVPAEGRGEALPVGFGIGGRSRSLPGRKADSRATDRSDRTTL